MPYLLLSVAYFELNYILNPRPENAGAGTAQRGDLDASLDVGQLAMVHRSNNPMSNLGWASLVTGIVD